MFFSKKKQIFLKKKRVSKLSVFENGHFWLCPHIRLSKRTSPSKFQKKMHGLCFSKKKHIVFSRLTPTTLRATVCASTKNKEKNACRLNPKILLLRFRDKKQFIFLVSITLLKRSVLLFVIRALHFKENIFFVC